MSVVDDLVQWLRVQLDDDALWAIEASRRGEGQAPEGGVHWQWVDPEVDEAVTPDPGNEEFVGGERFRVSLRSRELFPTAHSRDLPQFAIHTAEEVPSAVGGHIVRHDPARVLREIDAKRQLVEKAADADRYSRTTWANAGSVGAATAYRAMLRLLAVPYADRPGYREEWKP